MIVPGASIVRKNTICLLYSAGNISSSAFGTTPGWSPTKFSAGRGPDHRVVCAEAKAGMSRLPMMPTNAAEIIAVNRVGFCIEYILLQLSARHIGRC
jgi:hypothetical protein